MILHFVYKSVKYIFYPSDVLFMLRHLARKTIEEYLWITERCIYILNLVKVI